MNTKKLKFLACIKLYTLTLLKVPLSAMMMGEIFTRLAQWMLLLALVTCDMSQVTG